MLTDARGLPHTLSSSQHDEMVQQLFRVPLIFPAVYLFSLQPVGPEVTDPEFAVARSLVQGLFWKHRNAADKMADCAVAIEVF